MNANRVGHRPGWGGLAACRAWIARLAGFAALAAAGVALAQTSNSIEQVTVTRGAPGYTIVRFTLKAPPANPPAGFAITSPPRIALDFLDTANALAEQPARRRRPGAAQPAIVQAGNRTRVVFNLNKPQSFDTQVEGNDGRGHARRHRRRPHAAGRAGAGRSASPRRAATDQQHALRDIDFRRGRNGEGRIVVDLSDSHDRHRHPPAGPAPDRRLPARPRCRATSSAGSTSPTSARRCVTIDTFEQGGNARMVIEPKGLWEHSAYQTDNRFILEVKPVQEDPNKLVQGTRAGYTGEKLSLNFQNVEVRAVLQVIADFTGLNIITSDTVQRQPDAAPEGRAVGPGARHHPADQGPRHAQERQRRSDRAARGARAEGEAAARGAGADHRPRAAAHRDRSS